MKCLRRDGGHMFDKYHDWILIGFGLLGLFAGGESLIRGAVGLATRLRLPKLLIGLTVIGFGTSMPELLVSLKGVQTGATDIALGNVIGSNIANILLIAAAGALLRPLSARSRGVRRDAFVMLAATVGFGYLAWRGLIGQQEGVAMVGLLLLYMLVVYVMDRKNAADNPDDKEANANIPIALLFVAGGLAGLIFGADALVNGATHVAKNMGVSDAVIGLTLVAIGTSLPELTVSLVSAVKGQNELALGNVLGSNLFNILAVLGITAALKPVAIDPVFLNVDIPLMVASAAGLFLLTLVSPKVGRISAMTGLAIYGAYMAWLTLRG